MPPSIRDGPAAVAGGTRRFGAGRRLQRPAEFAAVLAAPRAQSLRATRHWLSMTAAWSPSDAPKVRFGVTVGRRNARRAVDRALVKRVLREASRHAAAALDAVCATRTVRLDVAFRLQSARLPGAPPSQLVWRRELRAEADALLARLLRHLAALPA